MRVGGKKIGAKKEDCVISTMELDSRPIIIELRFQRSLKTRLVMFDHVHGALPLLGWFSRIWDTCSLILTT